MPDQEGFFQEVDPSVGNQFFQEQQNPAPEQGQPTQQRQPQTPQSAEALQNGQQAPQEGQQSDDPGPQPRDLPDHMSPEHAYGMATYQQSRADRAQAEINRLKQEMEAMQTANPIASYVTRDPALLQQVLSYINGGQNSSSGQATPGAPAGVPQQPSLQKPEPPQRPAELEPYSDEAIAYQNALIDYQSRLAEYNQAMFDSQVNRLQEAERRRQQELQMQQQMSQLEQEAMYQYGLSKQEAQEFLRFAQDPSSTSDMGLWINAFKLRQGKAQQSPQQPQRQHGQATAADLARQRQQYPQTATAAPGAPGVNVQQQDSFFQPMQQPVQLW